MTKKGVQQTALYEGMIQIKVKGVPWSTTSYYVQIRQAILQILLNAESMGFKLYATIDPVLGTSSQVADTMYFRKMGPSWCPQTSRTSAVKTNLW